MNMCNGWDDGTERQKQNTVKGYKLYLMAKETKVFSTQSYTKEKRTEHTPNCNFQAYQRAQKGMHPQVLAYDEGSENPNLG